MFRGGTIDILPLALRLEGLASALYHSHVPNGVSSSIGDIEVVGAMLEGKKPSQGDLANVEARLKTLEKILELPTEQS